ncbi:MAG: hypothetical protein KJ556_08965 [Gammaproteobacteria bacterium]|nr:hypothetical protein [Gammaproteobacteria bacterium]MBU2059377.1 hypothetical protein [Gammaproteobacteria bacterium]MBU2175243.1 hypothetical protein [Gammaproteobacteria bacterium]MBU2247451.1 hypothetical protein [Gammaproteobacteria bacterium]MBU2346282.1 hypothetical protein [Gammaproteobacteria bacterium]
MAKYLLSLAVLMTLAAAYFYEFTTTIKDIDAVIKKAGGTALIAEKVAQLNSTDFGYPQLLNYFNGDLPATDWTVERMVKRQTIFDWLVGLEHYEVLFNYRGKTIMFADITLASANTVRINIAAIVYSDPY